MRRTCSGVFHPLSNTESWLKDCFHHLFSTRLSGFGYLIKCTSLCLLFSFDATLVVQISFFDNVQFVHGIAVAMSPNNSPRKIQIFHFTIKQFSHNFQVFFFVSFYDYRHFFQSSGMDADLCYKNGRIEFYESSLKNVKLNKFSLKNLFLKPFVVCKFQLVNLADRIRCLLQTENKITQKCCVSLGNK